MLKIHAFFHLNLMFSSLEEEARGEVIRRCYWPILRLAEDLEIPIGIEAPGITLEIIEALDPSFIRKLSALSESGLIEFIGSGYAQVIGPLVPAIVTRKNLAFGHETYLRLLGQRPKLALVNEQAYSASLVPLYREAGYEALFMDWDMCAHAHPEWPGEWRYHPHIAVGSADEIPLLWTNTVAFQKLQRLAHGEKTLGSYLDWVTAQAGGEDRHLCLYCNDAEVFDHRPGRFETEAALNTHAEEWSLVREAFRRLLDDRRIAWVKASDALLRSGSADAWQRLNLQSAAFPVPVKKQRKYNVSRWAVSGRSDFGINSRCRAIARRLAETPHAPDALWRRLVALWSSDLRTHITERRWAKALAELTALEARLDGLLAAPPANTSAAIASRPVRTMTANNSTSSKIEHCDRFLRVTGAKGTLVLNRRKGLAIESLAFSVPGAKATPICGTIGHGTYDDLVYAFDWFSGTLIAEFVGQPKITDLAIVLPEIHATPNGDAIIIRAEIPTRLGPIVKTIEADLARPRVAIRHAFSWPRSEKSTLRLGNITLLPGAVDPATLALAVHNGGDAPEIFPLHGEVIDHGAPVSFLVSATSGVGMTGGTIIIGDAARALRIAADPPDTAYLGLVSHRMIKDKLFCRISLSAGEIDETLRRSDAGMNHYDIGFALEPAPPLTLTSAFLTKH